MNGNYRKCTKDQATQAGQDQQTGRRELTALLLLLQQKVMVKCVPRHMTPVSMLSRLAQVGLGNEPIYSSNYPDGQPVRQ